MQVLLVQPDRSAALRFEQQLLAQQHVVTIATRAFEAIELLRTGRFGMMIADQALTDLEITDLARIARKMGLAQYLYIMVLATQHDQKNINAALAAGADDYMLKPVDPVELSLRVRNAERIVSIDTRDDAIIAMAKLAESRDATTGRHVERVRLYSRELAQAVWEMGFYFGQIDSTFVELIYRTAALHDLGKVAIPDAILTKPGKLTEAEFAAMQRHTEIGAAALASVETDHSRCQFLQMGREIALSHHERWDGRGYPRGLAGENIPLSARIVSVADVYDALTSQRSYKPAFTHDAAMRSVIENAGTQFDPLVVEAMAAIESSIDRYRKQEADVMAPPSQAA
ncbi:MAG TPA: HD domain-containing phosphohydrolase [Tepidisphaeraceae bacterium]|jgi:putative two-component system response regulator